MLWFFGAFFLDNNVFPKTDLGATDTFSGSLVHHNPISIPPLVVPGLSQSKQAILSVSQKTFIVIYFRVDRKIRKSINGSCYSHKKPFRRKRLKMAIALMHFHAIN